VSILFGPGRLLRLEILEQPGEARLENVVVLPVREIGDEVLADLDPQVLPAIRVEALPIPDRIEVNKADREELALALLDLGLSRLANLGFHPLAGNAFW